MSMFLELIATVAAGMGAAGVMMLLNRLAGGRLPRWMLPAAAGLAMIGFTMWSENTWAKRTAEAFPEGVVVVREVGSKIMWKPWTYAKPQVTRLMAVDLASVQRNPAAPDVRLFNMYLYGRWRAPSMVPQFVNCALPALANVSEAALADPVANADWMPITTDDKLYEVLCNA
ncbi:hypothetical protein [Actibacterium sp.]|uniref:hypothetical protein n=1 Tax=Actibacterium sp. TaxID=1872125 RepID=UPI00356789A4